MTSKKWNNESTNPVFTCFSNVFLEVFPDIFLVFAALKVEKTVFIDSLQGCRKRGAGGAPIFGRSVNPISTRGSREYPPNNTGTPGFSDLATGLIMVTKVVLSYQQSLHTYSPHRAFPLHYFSLIDTLVGKNRVI